MEIKLDLNSVADGIQKELKTYSDELFEEVEEKMQLIANECKKKVAEKSPKSKGKGAKKYAKGWAIKKEKHRLYTVYIIYNKNKPSLTHLLENGHIIKNKKDGKTYGRTDEYPHIEPAEKEAIKEMEGILK